MSQREDYWAFTVAIPTTLSIDRDLSDSRFCKAKLLALMRNGAARGYMAEGLAASLPMDLLTLNIRAA